MSENDVLYIKTKINEVVLALTGNPMSGDVGISKRLNSLEERFDNIEKQVSKTNIMVGLLWAAAGFVLCSIFTLIITKK